MGMQEKLQSDPLVVVAKLLAEASDNK